MEAADTDLESTDSRYIQTPANGESSHQFAHVRLVEANERSATGRYASLAKLWTVSSTMPKTPITIDMVHVPSDFPQSAQLVRGAVKRRYFTFHAI